MNTHKQKKGTIREMVRGVAGRDEPMLKRFKRFKPKDFTADRFQLSTPVDKLTGWITCFDSR